jgi:multimeric flavodoxin WrbA
MRHFLIVFHCQGQATQALAEAARDGALLEAGVETRLVGAADAGLDDLLWAHALLIASPENFGYMAGMIKDFFDRTFYPAQGKIQNLPYAVLIKCSNDGTGALSNIERIARGYPFKQVAEPLIVRGDVTEEALASARELGETLAAGLVLQIF